MSIYHNFKFTFEIQLSLQNDIDGDKYKVCTLQCKTKINSISTSYSHLQPCVNLLTTCVDSRTHRLGGVYEISQTASIHHLHAIRCEIKF